MNRDQFARCYALVDELIALAQANEGSANTKVAYIGSVFRRASITLDVVLTELAYLTPPAPARSDPPRPAPRPTGDAGTASR